jgi:hypothetical protein
VNELKGALLSMIMAKDFIQEKRFQASLQRKEENKGGRLYVDNKAVIALVNRGINYNFKKKTLQGNLSL